MPYSEDKRIRRIFKYEYAHYHRQEDILGVGDYVQNPILIEKLSKEKEIADANADELQQVLDIMSGDYHDLELQKKETDTKLEETKRIITGLEENLRLVKLDLSDTKQDLERLKTIKNNLDITLAQAQVRLEEAGRNSSIQFVISTMSSILLAIGVNIITTVANDWKGWTMIIVGIILGFIAFVLSRKKK